jgi:hypothetical protein
MQADHDRHRESRCPPTDVTASTLPDGGVADFSRATARLVDPVERGIKAIARVSVW